MSRVFTTVSFLALTTTCGVLAGPPHISGLSPLTAEPQAKDQQPMFYYNGDAKVYLFDTGQAVAKIKPAIGVTKFAARPEVITPPANSGLASLQDALQSQGLVVVRTRGPKSLSLQPADRPAEVEYVLPILREADRPVLPKQPQRRGEEAIIVMTSQISARFSDSFFTGVNALEAKRAKVEKHVGAFGLKIATPADKPLRIPNAYALTLADGEITYARLIEAANRLFERGSAAGEVVYAKPNFLRPLKLHQQPGVIQDPRFNNQWHLHNTGQAQGLVDADVDAIEAWRVTEGSPSVRIAIIDDSVQKNHPDLKANYQAGRHYTGAIGYDDDPSPRHGNQRHGTACAGIAVASANDIGVRGVAPKGGLIGVHIFDTQADQQCADGFYFCNDPDGDPATDDGAAVISCSWGLNPNVEIPVEVTTAVDEMARNGRNGNGIVILFAAGNASGLIASKQKLGARESVICVGATNFRDVRAGYSNYGPELDVMAPSNDFTQFFNDPHTPDFFPLAIDTTDNTDDQPRMPNNDRSGYAVGDYTGMGNTGFGGTSSATPLAAGVCGLILSANPRLTSTQVRAILEHTCDRVRGPEFFNPGGDPLSYDATSSHNIYYGYGRVNAGRSVLIARQSRAAPEIVWPDYVQELTAVTISSSGLHLRWKNPPNNVTGVLVVRSAAPIHWKPRDGERYQLNDAVGDGTARVVNVEPLDQLVLPADATNPTNFAVFAFSAEHRYSWGQVVEVSSPLPAFAGPNSRPAARLDEVRSTRTSNPKHEFQRRAGSRP